VSAVVRFARYVWAAPASVVGIALAPFFDRRRVAGGILVCEGARWPRRLGWRFSAITFGHVVLSTVAADDELMEHERAHVGQYERWGVFLLPAYLVASIWVRLRGRRAYWDNPFEKAARRAR
jgi:hypothetical protein